MFLQYKSFHLITGYRWSCWSSRSPRSPWSACESFTDPVIHLDSTLMMESFFQIAVLLFSLTQGPQGPKGAKGSTVSTIRALKADCQCLDVRYVLENTFNIHASIPGSCWSKRRHWCNWSSWSSCEFSDHYCCLFSHWVKTVWVL